MTKIPTAQTVHHYTAITRGGTVTVGLVTILGTITAHTGTDPVQTITNTEQYTLNKFFNHAS
jgi:hypothetical protein